MNYTLTGSFTMNTHSRILCTVSVRNDDVARRRYGH